MKTRLLIAVLLSSLLSFSQSTVKISVVGISPEAEQKILDHDMIPEAFGLNNVTLRLKNVDQKTGLYLQAIFIKWCMIRPPGIIQ